MRRLRGQTSARLVGICCGGAGDRRAGLDGREPVGTMRRPERSLPTEAAESLQADYDRVVQIRGQTGARVQDMESRQDRLDEQNIATTALLSQVEDTDYTQAIAEFQTLQTTLQASLATAQKVLNLSLMDFLG